MEFPRGDNTHTAEAGVFSRVADSRLIRGLLLPFGELSRPNQSGNEPIEFSADSIELPRDSTVVTLNVEHDRFNPIGRAVSLEKTDAGIVAEFAIADTDEGDAYLANPVRKLSAEVAGIVREGARALKSRLTGAAVVKDGAFASAALFSVAPDEAPKPEPLSGDALEALLAYVRLVHEGAQRVIADAEAAQTALTETTPDEVSASPEATPTAAPAEESTSDETKEFSMSETNEAGAQVPATLMGNAPAKKADVDMHAVFSAMASVKSRSLDNADAETMLAALADVTTPAHVTSGAIPQTFTGKLWQGKRYTQRYISLANHQQGGIALGGRKGFKIAQGTALVKEISGAAQKVELPTGNATTSTVSSTLRKFGYAADVALEWQYLDGGADVIQAFFEGVVDSAAKVIDESALADIFTVASRNSAALDRLVAPGTYPTQYPAAMGQLIQGIDLVSDNGDDASFAIVNPTAWNQLLYTPKDLVPEFVEFAVGIGTGEASTGKVRVVKAPQSFFTGTVATAPQMIVGARNAIEFREVHANIEALEVAKFGVDRAQVAFLETFVVRPESLSLIGTKP
ncbi:hypothetical protein DC432_06620 [Microbacterium testaceum]|uniref:Uncharacterized protein n=1 Tax=Microbacterium testaceum TaxID=2033 RepID=A0A2T7WQT1_MICTE|nr:hypothetical protein DC432_06620 [Microbacterium testaceum]